MEEARGSSTVGCIAHRAVEDCPYRAKDPGGWTQRWLADSCVDLSGVFGYGTLACVVGGETGGVYVGLSSLRRSQALLGLRWQLPGR